MALSTSTDAHDIAARLDPLIAADPVRHTVFATIHDAVSAPDAAPWCAWPDDAPHVLAARSQAHTPITVTGSWHEARELADTLAALPGEFALAGPADTVDELATELSARGRVPGRRMAERLFRLETLVPPAAVPGSARPATPDDLDLLTSWRAAFATEAFGATPDPDAARRLTEPDLRPASSRRYWLWCDADGTPCSFALRQQYAHGAARLGPVYTPPELRDRGFGSAVTAAATRDVLDDGAIPVLFTDLSNPVSNAIYPRLGYYPVEDHVRLMFDMQ